METMEEVPAFGGRDHEEVLQYRVAGRAWPLQRRGQKLVAETWHLGCVEGGGMLPPPGSGAGNTWHSQAGRARPRGHVAVRVAAI